MPPFTPPHHTPTLHLQRDSRSFKINPRYSFSRFEKAVFEIYRKMLIKLAVCRIQQKLRLKFLYILNPIQIDFAVEELSMDLKRVVWNKMVRMENTLKAFISSFKSCSVVQPKSSLSLLSPLLWRQSLCCRHNMEKYATKQFSWFFDYNCLWKNFLSPHVANCDNVGQHCSKLIIISNWITTYLVPCYTRHLRLLSWWKNINIF